MFFLPAELAKEAGNEVLSHWMGNLDTSQDVTFTLGHMSQFSFLAGQCNSFPILPPLSELLPKVYSGSVSTIYFSGSFFAFFVDSNSVMLIELLIKCWVIVKKSSPKNLSADCRSSIGRLSAVCWPTGFPQNIDYQSADKRPTVGRQLVMCQ